MRAVYAVIVDGVDISPVLSPILISLNVRDNPGTVSDTATIVVDDSSGQIEFPAPGVAMSVRLGWEGEGVGEVFRGTVHEVRSNAARGSGRVLTIEASGMDTQGIVKEPRRIHFDDKTVGEIMITAGRLAGVENVSVDPAFASIVRTYESMDGESFIAFGERLARELGGTFKVSGDRAVLAKRGNGGAAPSGVLLPTVTAAWGQNIHEWDISPYLGRPRFRRTRARYYDPEEARWKEVLAETEIDGAEATAEIAFAASDEAQARAYADARRRESEREAGEGSVTIDGNILAQAEGTCLLVGARSGIDGSYRIESVEHTYARSGFTTALTLREPKGAAGKAPSRESGRLTGIPLD